MHCALYQLAWVIIKTISKTSIMPRSLPRALSFRQQSAPRDKRVLHPPRSRGKQIQIGQLQINGKTLTRAPFDTVDDKFRKYTRSDRRDVKKRWISYDFAVTLFFTFVFFPRSWPLGANQGCGGRRSLVTSSVLLFSSVTERSRSSSLSHSLNTSFRPSGAPSDSSCQKKKHKYINKQSTLPTGWRWRSFVKSTTGQWNLRDTHTHTHVHSEWFRMQSVSTLMAKTSKELLGPVPAKQVSTMWRPSDRPCAHVGGLAESFDKKCQEVTERRTPASLFITEQQSRQIPPVTRSRVQNKLSVGLTSNSNRHRRPEHQDTPETQFKKKQHNPDWPLRF